MLARTILWLLMVMGGVNLILEAPVPLAVAP